MKKQTVLKRLYLLKSKLSAVGVVQLGLFGSTVRGENTPKSDIDILLDFRAGEETYPNFLTACQILEDKMITITLPQLFLMINISTLSRKIQVTGLRQL